MNDEVHDRSWSSYGLPRDPVALRRLRSRVWPAYAILLIWSTWIGWPEHVHAPGWQRLIAAVLPGILGAFIVYELHHYVVRQDELQRKLNYEAFAWTYLIGIVMWTTLWGCSEAEGWQLGNVWAYGIVLLDMVRAFILYCLARRYQ
jgi:hypothetical protein